MVAWEKHKIVVIFPFWFFRGVKKEWRKQIKLAKSENPDCISQSYNPKSQNLKILTSNIRHPTSAIRHIIRDSWFLIWYLWIKIQHPTLNIEHSTLNIRHPQPHIPPTPPWAPNPLSIHLPGEKYLQDDRPVERVAEGYVPAWLHQRLLL